MGLLNTQNNPGNEPGLGILPGLDMDTLNTLLQQYIAKAPKDGDVISKSLLNIQPRGPFLGRTFAQTYNGQPGPYENDGAQILDARNVMNSGAGRFGNNMGARFSFQGGNAPWRQDHNKPNQPIAPYGYNPQAPLTPPAPPVMPPEMPPRMPPGMPPRMPPGMPPPGMGAGQGGSAPGAPGLNMNSWRALAQSNPTAANTALNANPAFLQQNQAAIGQTFRSANSPQSSNAGPISVEDFDALVRSGMTQRPPEWALDIQRKAKAAGQPHNTSYDAFLGN